MIENELKENISRAIPEFKAWAKGAYRLVGHQGNWKGKKKKG